jgi:hypothetical protein
MPPSHVMAPQIPESLAAPAAFFSLFLRDRGSPGDLGTSLQRSTANATPAGRRRDCGANGFASGKTRDDFETARA